jgi:hypothetical protein
MGGGASRPPPPTKPLPSQAPSAPNAASTTFALCRKQEPAEQVVERTPAEPPEEPLPLAAYKQRTLDEAEAEADAVATEFTDEERVHLRSRYPPPLNPNDVNPGQC